LGDLEFEVSIELPFPEKGRQNIEITIWNPSSNTLPKSLRGSSQEIEAQGFFRCPLCRIHVEWGEKDAANGVPAMWCYLGNSTGITSECCST
jgi:hypothetical protein